MDDLLTRLVVAYGETFDPRLHELIERLGIEESHRRGALRAKSKVELEAAWLAIAAARDPGDVDRLLGTPWPGAWKIAMRRVHALGLFPKDPRIAKALRTIEKQYSSGASQPLHRAVDYAAVAMSGAPLGAASETLLFEAKSAIPSAIDPSALWRSFREDPTDEARRMVLADALQTVGDPRGEFIALSNAIAEGAADAKVHKRAAQLLDAHIDAWTGALPGVERSSRRFERGFLVRVKIKMDEKALARALDAPEWCTIRELHVDSAKGGTQPHQVLAALLERMPALRTLVLPGWGSGGLLTSLIGSFPQVRAVGAHEAPTTRLASFPSLALLAVVEGQTRIDRALVCAERCGITTLLQFGVQDLEKTVRALDGSGVLEGRFVSGDPHSFPFDHHGWLVRASRNRAEAALSWGTGRFRKGSLVSMLQALARVGRRRMTIAMPRVGHAEAVAEAEAAREALAVQGVTLDLGGEMFDAWAI